MWRQGLTLLALSAFALTVLTQVGCSSKPKTQTVAKKVEQRLHLKGRYRSIPWKRGGRKDAMRMAVAGQTIPLSQYTFTASKDGHSYSGVLVGTSPFSKTLASSNISAIVVPLKITIGTTLFDPTAPDSCDNNVSALTRFRQSPLANDVPSLMMNGVDVGNVQFINGFRRAEFWTTIKGSPSYQNEMTFSFAEPYELTAEAIGSHGTATGDGCAQIGIVSNNWLDAVLQSTVIPALTNAHVVSPRSVIFFLMRNTVQSETDPPALSSCCILGYHSAVGTPIQSYGTVAWDTSGNFTGVSDASVASHEIGEWMDDPLATNPTPAWGGVGQDLDCQNNWEVGDPLSGTLMRAITMNGKDYQMQELGFFSWYFNKDTDASVGAGSTFSSNGTFSGPSKACPPGGTN